MARNYKHIDTVYAIDDTVLDEALKPYIDKAVDKFGKGDPEAAIRSIAFSTDPGEYKEINFQEFVATCTFITVYQRKNPAFMRDDLATAIANLNIIAMQWLSDNSKVLSVFNYYTSNDITHTEIYKLFSLDIKKYNYLLSNAKLTASALHYINKISKRNMLYYNLDVMYYLLMIHGNSSFISQEIYDFVYSDEAVCRRRRKVNQLGGLIISEEYDYDEEEVLNDPKIVNNEISTLYDFLYNFIKAPEKAFMLMHKEAREVVVHKDTIEV